MGQITCQFVRPDRLLYEGEIASLVLVTPTGELGVWPGHAPEIVALGNGVVRIHRLPADGGAIRPWLRAMRCLPETAGAPTTKTRSPGATCSCSMRPRSRTSSQGGLRGGHSHRGRSSRQRYGDG